MDVYVSSKRIRLDPVRAIGKGGEADVYDIGGGMALKIFKTPLHPDLQYSPVDQDAARERIEAHQKKLPALRALQHMFPHRVVMPKEFATERNGGEKIVGYTMPLISGAEALYRYSDLSFRRGGVSNEAVKKIFTDLHGTVRGIHRAGVVVGDFNDLNVLVRDTEAYVIDADSFQFGAFLCVMFTVRFLDPTLCDPRAAHCILSRPYGENSDWYAYAVMLMQSLLFVGPYGGMYRPKDPKNRMPQEVRPLKRITVFSSEVQYPKPAIPYRTLPDDLLHHFYQVFEKDMRGEFPLMLVDALRWTKCSACGMEHARAICPHCVYAAPQVVHQKIVVRGTVTATRVFRTKGSIVYATYQKGKLCFLYHQDGEFRREDHRVIVKGNLDPQLRFRIQGIATFFGKENRMFSAVPDGEGDYVSVDAVGRTPLFDTNATYQYWVRDGALARNNTFGPFHIGNVLAGQTRFWVGRKFGLGFYRAGNLCQAFLFDSERAGINDSLKIPIVSGTLVDAACVFSDDRAWFFLAFEEKGKIRNRCIAVRREGIIEAIAECDAQDGSWLGTIHGTCASGVNLFAATDEGIVRLETSGGTIVQTREFPDTEPFVDSSTKLFAGDEGIFVVTKQEVTLLRIA